MKESKMPYLSLSRRIPGGRRGERRKRFSAAVKQFRTYYLVPTLAIIVAALAAILILSRVFGQKEETLLYAAVFDHVMNTQGKEQVQEEMLSALTEKDEDERADDLVTVTMDDSFRTTNGKDAERLLVLAANHSVDVLIGSKDVIAAFAGYGYLYDLDTLLSEREQEAWQSRLLLLPGYLEDDKISFEDTETGQGEEKQYGISLAGSPLMAQLGCDTEDMYAGIVLECGHKDNAVWFLEKALEGTQTQ